MNNKNLLLVEDDPFVSRIIINTLLEFNPSIGVYLAETGEEALNELKERAFSIILLDIELPLVDGLEILRITKPSYYSPFIMISANRSNIYINKAYYYGASSYLCKIPLEPFLSSLLIGLDFYLNNCQLPTSEDKF